MPAGASNGVQRCPFVGSEIRVIAQRERERENYGNRDPLLEGGGQKADRPILPPAKVTPDKPGFLRALAR